MRWTLLMRRFEFCHPGLALIVDRLREKSTIRLQATENLLQGASGFCHPQRLNFLVTTSRGADFVVDLPPVEALEYFQDLALALGPAWEK
jgi:hypothetical protein